LLLNLLNKCACIINRIEISILFFNIDLFKDRVLFDGMYKSTGYYLSACAKMTGYYLSGYYLSVTHILGLIDMNIIYEESYCKLERNVGGFCISLCIFVSGTPLRFSRVSHEFLFFENLYFHVTNVFTKHFSVYILFCGTLQGRR